MKTLYFIFASLILLSCNTPTERSKIAQPPPPKGIKTELYFENCDSLLAFLKTIVVTNDMDEDLHPGQFRLRYARRSFEEAATLFPEECFIGLTEEELVNVMGRWDYAGEFEDHVVVYHVKGSLWGFYRLLAIDAYSKNGIITKFKVVPGSDNYTF